MAAEPEMEELFSVAQRKVDEISESLKKLQGRLEKMGAKRKTAAYVKALSLPSEPATLGDQLTNLEQQMDLALRRLKRIATSMGIESESKIDENTVDYDDGKMPLPGTIQLENWSKFQNLKADLDLLRAKFGKLCQSLLKQQWLELPGSRMGGKEAFKVVQFNILADGLCTAYSNDRSDKTFLGVDKAMLRWTYRGFRLLDLIFHQLQPDLLFIEECDRYDFFQPWLAKYGFESEHRPKQKSPTRHCASAMIEEFPDLVGKDFTCAPDGLVVAWKSTVFERTEDAIIKIGDKENPNQCVALVVPLKHRHSGLVFNAVCTHLKSDKDRGGEQKRLNQVNALFGGAAVDAAGASAAEEGPLLKLKPDTPMICGFDMNANPFINRHGYAPRAYEWLTSADGGRFTSAYREGSGAEPDFTTAKKRINGVDMHTIDYIFYRDMPEGVKLSAALTIPVLPKGQLIPDWNYPSDHFAIGVEFTVGEIKARPSEMPTYDLDDAGKWPPLPGQTKPAYIGHLGSDLRAMTRKFFGSEGVLPKTHEQKWKLVRDVGGTKKSHSFSMVTWNCLADALSTGYTLEPTKKDFLDVDKKMLRWSYRGLRLMEHILRLGTDVLCIQECDFFGFLNSYLPKFGYQCYFVPKDRSPTRHVAKAVADERGLKAEDIPVQNDGVCIALKNSAFELLHEPFEVKQSDTKTKTFGLFLHVKHVDSEREMVIGNTHLKSDKDLAGEQLRVSQIQELIGNKFATQFGSDKLALFLGCDMNCAPNADGKDYDPLCYQECVGSLQMKSAYEPLPLYTTLKKRESGIAKHTIDYVWMKNSELVNAEVTHLLSIPGLNESDGFQTEEDPRSGPLLIPDWEYPSDHFAIGAVFHLA